MEAGFLQFDPSSEFEILETLEFEEEIQRPESLRFFTLDEQLNDFFDKVLPKKKVVTKFEYKRIANEIDRIRELYGKTITLTDTDYVIDTTRKDVSVDWIKPIYSDFTYQSYSYSKNWSPLWDNRRIPNYYNQLLLALPKPYKALSQDGVPITKSHTLVNEDGKGEIQALGLYERTKGVIHEDGSFSIISLPVQNTNDDIRIKGYYMYDRKLDIPNPLDNHPFLSTNKESKLLTDEPLNVVFPTLEAIMTHGIPISTDPYVESKPFLKVYDISLSSIPWNLWKERFPPVETINYSPTVQSISFPKDEERTAPSKSLQDLYLVDWLPALEPRFWLTMQEDAGSMVPTMLLSKASSAGLLPPDTSIEKPKPQFPSSTPEDCFAVNTFDEFLNAGIYRLPSWSDINSAINKSKPIPDGTCVPTSYLEQEKQDLVKSGRIAWKETTEIDILKDHQTRLKQFQYKEPKQKETTYEKYTSRPDSELRKEVVALLADEERTHEDKVYAIELILRGRSVHNKIYVDTDDSFIVCSHTLSVLKGDLERDRLSFYADWTAIDEGFRVCKFCGEQINADVVLAQDDFDENGNPIISHDILEGSGFKSESHVESFINSLNNIKPLFNFTNAGETILYLLLSLLQVLPTESQLLPVLGNIRKLSLVLKANKKLSEKVKDRAEGILGIAGMVVLLQTHTPFLIPRRSFGSKILRLSGFPRDTEDPSDSPTLDIILTCLKTTFESTPSTFKGPIVSILRSIITKPKDVRKDTIPLLKQAHSEFRVQFESAKERYVSPPETETFSQVTFPIIRVEKDEFKPSELTTHEERMSQCDTPSTKSVLLAKLPPNVIQEPVVLSQTKPSKYAQFIIASIETVEPIQFNEKDIRKRLTTGFPKGIKLDKIEKFLRSDTDGVAILSLMNRVLDISIQEGFSLDQSEDYRAILVYMQTRLDPSLLRDAAQGVVYELLHAIEKDPKKITILQALTKASQVDLIMNMILLTKEMAERQDAELRARERDAFKMKMRNLNDTEREITKQLLDIGIAPYIITNEDREIFAREYNYSDAEKEYAEIQAQVDIDMPEEGYNASRDNDDDEVPVVNRQELEVDYGDYGDRREHPVDRDYESFGNFDFEEGYGV
jgi:hypothetical protein